MRAGALEKHQEALADLQLEVTGRSAGRRPTPSPPADLEQRMRDRLPQAGSPGAQRRPPGNGPCTEGLLATWRAGTGVTGGTPPAPATESLGQAAPGPEAGGPGPGAGSRRHPGPLRGAAGPDQAWAAAVLVHPAGRGPAAGQPGPGLEGPGGIQGPVQGARRTQPGPDAGRSLMGPARPGRGRAMRMYDLIYAKKTGGRLSDEQIAFWVRGGDHGHRARRAERGAAHGHLLAGHGHPGDPGPHPGHAGFGRRAWTSPGCPG